MAVFRGFAAVLLVIAVTAAQVPDNVISQKPKPNSESIDKEKFGELLIIDGVDAKQSEFPHMAAVGYKVKNKTRYLCGCSLISLQWVVTAGHCVQNTRTNLVPETVRLGDIRPEAAGPHPHAQDFVIIRIEAHPNYKYPKKYNDIAMLKLNKLVQLNDYVGVACLNKLTTIPSATAVATGWGKTESANLSQNLRKVTLPFTPFKKCASLYNKLIQESNAFKELLQYGIKPTMLCAGYDEGGKDTCQGDSGGPLQIKKVNGACKWVIVGITSFGNQCAQPNNYAVYTRVSSFYNWINAVIRS